MNGGIVYHNNESQIMGTYGNNISIETGTETKNKDIKDTKRSKPKKTILAAVSSPTCPHSEGNSAPVCWDCTEQGHVEQDAEFSSLTTDSIRLFRKHVRHGEDNSSWGGSTLAGSTLGKWSTSPGWHPRESGFEPRYPGSVSAPGNQVSKKFKCVSVCSSKPGAFFQDHVTHPTQIRCSSFLATTVQ